MGAIAYKKAEIADNWDTIVIGSGISGLTTASLLGKFAGQRVLVLERHYEPGGFTHTFRRPGYEWDVGVHYVGDVEKGSVLRAIFDEVGDGSLEWADMGAVYDTIVIGDKTYPFPKGRENFRAALKEWFPGEDEAIDTFLAMTKSAIKTSLGYQGNKAMPDWMAKLSGRVMRKPFLKFSRRTTREVLEELTDNQELIAVLTGQFGDYGLPPAQSSFMIQAMITNHYMKGGYYPVGGSGRIADSIIPAIEEKGGQVIINAEVDEIVIENGKAVGVKMARDGRVLRAKSIVSSAGVNTTITKLLPETTAAKSGLQKKLQHVKPTIGHICLYIGLNKTAAELDLPKSNYWVYINEKHEENFDALQGEYDPEAPLPLIYISFPGAKDPTYSERFPGHSAIDIITAIPYEWFSKWEGTRWMKRGDDYEAFKQELADKFLAKLYELFPQVEDAVEIAELSTPLSTKHFCNYQVGELYGIEHDPERFDEAWLRPSTPIKGLYLTGQDIVTAGVAGALFAGVLSASTIARSNLVAKILEKHKR